MRHVFNTSVGTVEVLVDRDSDMLSVYRFDADHRPIAAAMESWSRVDLVDVLNRQAGVPLFEANTIASQLRAQHSSTPSFAARVEESRHEREWRPLESAGIALRFVAVVLDTLLVFVPLSFVVGWLSGGAYTQQAAGNTTYGMNVTDRPFLLLLALGIAYYIACETVTGATLGKRMVGIRVVGEDGEPVTFGAAIVRNLVRIVDAFFFYFVAFISALLSKRRQRLGDRAAHTIVVRR